MVKITRVDGAPLIYFYGKHIVLVKKAAFLPAICKHNEYLTPKAIEEAFAVVGLRFVITVDFPSSAHLHCRF